MATKKKSTYTPMPEVPEGAAERYQLVLEVLSGKTTVTDAAKRLGISRNRFQTLMHRSLEAMLAALEQQTPGRPAMPETERQLREENEQLKRQVERLEGRVNTIDRLLGVASDMLQGRVQSSRPRQRRTKTTSPTSTEGSDDEAEHRLEVALVMRSCGLRAPLCAAVVGVGASTLRRWSARACHGRPPRRPSWRAPAPLAPEAAERVCGLVRELRGLVGAEALRHMVPGVSRRQAAALKHETLTAMEEERIAGATRVTVLAAGIVRGFDAMHVRTTRGWRFPLVSADASVPYRTRIDVALRYDGAHVAAALQADFEEHGAPLVVRLDRARCHDTDEVRAVLDAYGVLVLHGPPHHPGFYGQLERQNREHRGWLDAAGVLTPAHLERETVCMRAGLNGLWRRPTLGFRTSEEVWKERTLVTVSRDELRQEVHEHAERMLRERAHNMQKDMAERIAIQRALFRRGYLSCEVGGWC